MVTYSIFELKDNKKLVMVRYKDVVDAPLAEGLTAAELVAKANEAIASESGSGEAVELPAVAEVKSIKTRVCKVPAEASEESGSESGSSEKYAIVASVRYVSEAEESESL